MSNRGKKPSQYKKILIQHIQNNVKEYASVILIFLIGVILGVIFINKAGEEQIQEITGYIQEFVTQLKNEIKIDQMQLLTNSLLSNLFLAILLWFMGSTVIGIPIVYGIVGYRGFCIGYTIAAAIATLGSMSGVMFSVTSILFQNILFIPGILALAVSGIKLYKSIMKDKRKETIKLEITRHTVFSVVILLFLEISAFLEVYISTNLLQLCVKYL